MQVMFRAKHLTLTEALKDYAKKKLSRLEKHFDHPLSADVMFLTERNLHVIEVTLHANGTTLRGEEKTESMYASIDQVTDILERRVQKLKNKLQSHHRPNGELSPLPAAAPRKEPRISSRRQKVPLFTIEEATQEMELRGYGFYLFWNRESEALNLVHRQGDGNYAVIEPIL